MLVHSLWDQEDIYGTTAVYKAIEAKDVDNDKVFLVMGPWYHGQEIADGSALGALKFHADTALEFRRDVLARTFLAQHLKEQVPRRPTSPTVTAARTRDERVEAAARLAAEAREGKRGRVHAALSPLGPEAELRCAGCR